MNEIQVFENKEFGELRVLEIDGKPYFVASEAAKMLGYSNSRDAISRHCRWVAKHDIPHPQSKTKTLEVNMIPEGDLYRLITHSELSSAKKFESWVFDEVLPSIRKHGGYLTPQKIEEVLLNPDTIIHLATQLKEERTKNKALEETVESQKPAVLFAESVSASSTSILVGEMAKILNQNGIDTGEKRLYEWLRENGYLIKRRGTDWNMPTQKSIEMNLFEISETTINHNSGKISIRKTTKVTGKGQRYFIDKFVKNESKQLSIIDGGLSV